MKIMFIGGNRQIFSLFETLKGDSRRHVITHCMDGAQAITDLEDKGDAYDWIILEGGATVGEGATVARAIRAMGYNVPFLFLSLDEVTGGGPPTLSLVYAVEKSSKGPIIRHCRLAEKTPANVLPASEDILFEYPFRASASRRDIG